jgi:2-polyprenyl-3-methyl-5-hydroxy-6-metoxy-1,4-benzoquinol methylase
MRDLQSYSEDYINQPFESYQVEYRKKLVLEIIQRNSHKNILEVGCGIDPLFNHVSDFDSLTILEPSTLFYQKAVDEVSKRDLGNSVKVFNNFFEDSIESVNSKNFDLIIISGLIHEISDLTGFFLRLQELVKPGTVVHINVPNGNSLHRLLAVEMGLIKSQLEMSNNNIQLQQNRVFDLGSLEKLVTDYGFEVIEKASYFIKPFTHGQMQKMIDNNIIDTRVLDGFYKLIRHLPDFGSEIYINFKK